MFIVLNDPGKKFPKRSVFTRGTKAMFMQEAMRPRTKFNTRQKSWGPKVKFLNSAAGWRISDQPKRMLEEGLRFYDN